MFARFSLPVLLVALMAIVHIGAATDPTSAVLERLRQIQVRTPKRQSNGGLQLSMCPAQCQQGCAPIINALNTCSAVSCLCNAVNDSSLGQCLSCCASTKPTAAVIQDSQKALDTYNTICEGTGVSSLSLSITTSQSGNPLSGGSTSVPATSVTGSLSGASPSSSTSKLPSTAIRALPSFPFASIALVFVIPLLA